MSYKKENKEFSLYSFDIFDTLVTRRTATPKGIFAIMQQILMSEKRLPSFLKENFYQIRVGAESFARYRAMNLFKTAEISYDDIYEIIQYNYNLSDADLDFLKQLEISIEIANLVPIQRNIEKLKEFHNNGKKVVLISDMYLGEKYLRTILSKIDPIFSEIKIYSSADYKVSKSNSGLYIQVKKAEQVDYNKWQHYGDNKQADIKVAKALNISPIEVYRENLTQYEQFLINSGEEQAFVQAVIGSAKLARQFSNDQNNKKYNFGASFAAPILYFYVDWILKQAKERGFRTLYFVARDGYIPKIIADIIIEKNNLQIKTKYLYGSRLAWREITESNYDSMIDSFFLEYKKILTPKLIAYRLGIDAKEVAEYLGLSSINTKFKNSNCEKYAEIFKTNENIRKRLIEHCRKKADLLREYFNQEIDFSQKDIAFVDLHGSGRTQDFVADFLNSISPCKLFFFYLTNSMMKQNESSVKLSYCADGEYLSHWIELLCRTMDGQTTGYKSVKGKIEPVTEPGNRVNMLRWGFEEYFNGIKEFVHYMIDMENKNAIKFNTVKLYCRYFEYFMNFLDKDTAKIMGDIPYAPVGEEKIMRAAPKLNAFEVLFNFILGRKFENYSNFPNISLARSNYIVKRMGMF